MFTLSIGSSINRSVIVWAIMSAISSATVGMTSALVRFERASTQMVARAATGSEDIVEPMVEIIQARAQFRASAAVVQTAGDMVQAIIDIKA